LRSLEAENKTSRCQLFWSLCESLFSGRQGKGKILVGGISLSPTDVFAYQKYIVWVGVEFSKSPLAILTIFYLYCYVWRHEEDVKPLGSQRYDDCSVLCQREDVQSSSLHEVVVLYNVRGTRYDCSFAPCVRGKMCSLLHKGGVWSPLYQVMWASFIGIWFFVRCEELVPNAKGTKMLVCWHWLGTCRPRYLSTWLLAGLELVGHSCRPGHLSAWLLISLVTHPPGYLSTWHLSATLVGLGTCRPSYSSAWLLVDLTLVSHSCRPRHLSAWLLISLVTCRPGYSSAWLLVGLVICQPGACRPLL